MNYHFSTYLCFTKQYEIGTGDSLSDQQITKKFKMLKVQSFVQYLKAILLRSKSAQTYPKNSTKAH